jgi:hypothetical protein
MPHFSPVIHKLSTVKPFRHRLLTFVTQSTPVRNKRGTPSTRSAQFNATTNAAGPVLDAPS